MATNDPFQMANYNQMNRLLKMEDAPQAATGAKRGPKPKKAPKAAPSRQEQIKRAAKSIAALGRGAEGLPLNPGAKEARADWLARLLLGELASNPKALAQVTQETRLCLIHQLSRLTP